VINHSLTEKTKQTLIVSGVSLAAVVFLARRCRLHHLTHHVPARHPYIGNVAVCAAKR
jgi:hypothetical protein